MPETAAALASAPVVVITRPLAQAVPLQQKIAALGRRTALFPLLDILPLDDTTALDAALADLNRYALVAFVSPNAIDAAFARRRDWPTNVPLAVMGEGSRQALAAHGVTEATHRIHRPRDPERTDSQTLLAALEPATLAGRDVLILRGDTGRELLADSLRAGGARVTQVATYRRAAPVLDAAAQSVLVRLVAQDSEWIITSSEALRVLMSMVASSPAEVSMGVARLQQQRLLVPHVRIAETAQTLGFCNVRRCASGDEHILAALQFSNE